MMACPIRAARRPGGTRHVGQHASSGGYDLAVVEGG